MFRVTYQFVIVVTPKIRHVDSHFVLLNENHLNRSEVNRKLINSTAKNTNAQHNWP